MSRRPPPLQLLPAFEATARLMSFSKAAIELHVTASAVSQQIKLLEDHLGLALFRRLTRRIELTEAGEAFHLSVAQTLKHYRDGHADLLHRFSRPVMRISMSPFVAHEVILPALAGFQAEHPETDLRLETSMGLVDFELQTMDAAIRFGMGQWPGLEALPLGACQATLVAAPALLQRLPVHSVQDLARHTLIHLRDMDWDSVALAAGVQRIPRKGDLRLDTDLAALHAAEQGLGVAIALLPMCRRMVDEGRLAVLSPPVALPMKTYFVFRQSDGHRDQLMAVYHWVKAQFDALAARYAAQVLYADDLLKLSMPVVNSELNKAM